MIKFLLRKFKKDTKESEMVQNLSSERIVFVANSILPTLQMYFTRPLKIYAEESKIVFNTITEQELKSEFGKKARSNEAEKYFLDKIFNYSPTVIIFCRYSGPHAESIINLAKSKKIPTIYYIDDDLLNIPITLGEKKYEFHNNPTRINTVRFLLNNSTMVYCSNSRLEAKLKNDSITNIFYTGKICGFGSIQNLPEMGDPKKIGYMGFDHANDFEIVLPSLIKILEKYPDCSFEIFGAIPKPSSLDQFGERVSVILPIHNYEDFLTRFKSLRWGIAICPLVKDDFNLVKSNIKWIEYSSIGAAVVATKDTVYNECCAENCGVLCDDDEWFSSLEYLILNNSDRLKLIANAQNKVTSSYTPMQLHNQILEVIQKAKLTHLSDS